MIVDYRELPCQIDMVPYRLWYQQITQEVAIRCKGRSSLFVEAGVRFGCSARIIREILQPFDNWRLVLIDPYPELEAEALVVDSRITIMKEGAETAALSFEDDSVDFFHIDVDIDNTHPYELSKYVLDAFMPKIKQSGILIFHDCSYAFPGITQLVDELKSAGWLAYYCLPATESPGSVPVCLIRGENHENRGIQH